MKKKITEKEKTDIAQKILVILPHTDTVRNQFGGITRQTHIPREALDNLLKYVFSLIEN